MAEIAHREGIPMMRPMMMEFPEDPSCHYLDRQYMLGESILVAPIFNSDGIADFYLPEGKWTSLITGESVVGGSWQRKAWLHITSTICSRKHTYSKRGRVKSCYEVIHNRV